MEGLFGPSPPSGTDEARSVAVRPQDEVGMPRMDPLAVLQVEALRDAKLCLQGKSGASLKWSTHICLPLGLPKTAIIQPAALKESPVHLFIF
jgi:hypothetical protein